MQLFQIVSISLGSINNTKQNFMQTFSNILLVCELILFTLLVANLGNLIINFLIDQDANN